ncbi:MAG: ROK family protein [Candidatus Omnitrophica bacterium]|nr:ROK family protein [Candidatus Omnitrophota bacterium]
MKTSIGVDVGGTGIKAVILKKDGSVVAKREIPTPPRFTPRECAYVLKELIRGLAAQSREERCIVEGIGIGLPGLIDRKRGIVRYLVNIEGWRDVPLVSMLERDLKKNMHIDNDVNAMCLGQLLFGQGRRYRNFLCVTLGTGVGGALVFHKRLYRGSTGSAGEIGHMKLVTGGRHCNCGADGCLEAYIGNARIAARARRLFRSRRATPSRYTAGSTPALEDITAAARKGDPLAKGIWEDVALYLGTTLANIINLLDLEAVIVGGGVANAGGVLFNPLRRVIQEKTMRQKNRKVAILRAMLGKYAGAIGAGALTWEE